MDKKKKTSAREDRISELPEFIIHRILAFLGSYKHVAQTSVLSKRWRQLWYSYPISDFDENYFERYLGYRWSKLENFDREKVEEFHTYVDNSLQRFLEHKIRIKQFRVFMTIPKITSIAACRHDLLHKWIKIAQENLVEEINLRFDTDNGTFYCLPEILLSSNSLQVLKLSGCRFEQHFLRSNIDLNSLRVLSLCRIHIDEQVLQNLISGCPLIEKLNFDSCIGMKKFLIFGLHNLRSVRVCHKHALEKVAIEAPRLENFDYQNHGRNGLWGWGQNNNTQNCEIEVACSPCFRKLEFMDDNITDQFFCNFISKFSLLQSLSLLCCNMLEKIRISGHWLKQFSLRECEKVVEVEFDTPNLLSFDYCGSTMPTLYATNAPSQWKADLVIHSTDHLTSSWFVKLRQFLSYSSQVKSLYIVMGSKKINSFDLEEFKDVALPHIIEPEYLELEVLSTRRFQTIIDGLLWSCHPKSLPIQQSNEGNFEFVKFFCNKLVNRQDSCCCHSSYMKCWQHYLKDVQIEYIGSTEYRRPLDRDMLDALHPNLVEQNEVCFRLKW